jgi:magnesium transporter
MIKYLVCKNGYHEVPEYCSKAWVRVTNPTQEETQFLIEHFHVPESFLNDIEDIDERPRIEYEDDWRMIIIRVPYKLKEEGDFFGTVPLGILTSGEKFITVCHHNVEMVDDLVYFSRRKSFGRSSPQLSTSKFFLR